MRYRRLITLAVAALCVAQNLQAQHRQLFDAGWQFTKIVNGKSLNSQLVDLPHDWDIYAGPNPETGATGTGGGWYPGGKGEYRKKFTTPKADLVKLHFEGVYQKAEVFVNGQKAGQHAYGYTPFTIDVTPYLYKDKRSASGRSKGENEVLVKVDNSEQPNCRWYSGSGIYRHVWLETMDDLHFAENGVRIWTPEVSDKQARVDLNIWVENEGQETRQIDDVEVTFQGGTFSFLDERPQRMYSPSVRFSNRAVRLPVALKTVVVDSETPAVQELKKIENVALKPGQVATYVLSYTIDQPRLWSPDAPYLYEATIRLKSEGRVIGEQRAKFGIRTFSFTAGKGFVLNGQPLPINGACLHHDDGVLGAMAFDAAEIRKVRQMKEAGFNLIRTSHNPPSRAFLDACDSIGMLVVDEAFDGWRQEKTKYDYSTLIDSCYREDIHAMVERDINHPSIVCWSIGNEVMERKDIRVVTTARQLKQAIKEIDNTRPVTEALCSWTPNVSCSRRRAFHAMPSRTGSWYMTIPISLVTLCGQVSTISESRALAAIIIKVNAPASTTSMVDSPTGTAPTAAMSISRAGASPSATTARYCGKNLLPYSIWLFASRMAIVARFRKLHGACGPHGKVGAGQAGRGSLLR